MRRTDAGILVLSAAHDAASRACVPIDVAALTQVVRSCCPTRTPSGRLHVAFLGSGCAESEVALLRALRDEGAVRLGRIAFLDAAHTIATVRHVQSLYAADDDPANLPYLPTLVFSYGALLGTWLEQPIAPADTRLVLGLNASFVFDTPSDLYDCHRFMCACARMARENKVNAEFINVLGDTNHVPSEWLTRVAPGCHVYRRSWWDFAEFLITCTAARDLLVGFGTAAR